MEKFKHIIFDHDGTLVDTSDYPPKLFRGVKDLLDSLDAAGIKMYLWTARSRTSTVEILQSLAIIDHFQLLSCGGETAPKPSSAGIENLYICASKEDIVVIGDSLGDMLGAKSFGCLAIGALWAFGSLDSQKIMQEHGAQICFDDIKNLKRYLINKEEI